MKIAFVASAIGICLGVLFGWSNWETDAVPGLDQQSAAILCGIAGMGVGFFTGIIGAFLYNGN